MMMIMVVLKAWILVLWFVYNTIEVDCLAHDNFLFQDEVAVIDEIQMIKDPARGWAWTRALLGWWSYCYKTCALWHLHWDLSAFICLTLPNRAARFSFDTNQTKTSAKCEL